MGSSLEQATMRRVTWRLVPFLCVLYTIAFIDRINVGFAALTMSKDLGLTPTMFGFGAGLFFIAYFLFEVPSNLMLDKVGARRWIARVMITWGIISMGFAFIDSANQFYVLRFLLGIAEAGFFPGVILYLTYWFPKRWRGRVTAGFVVAIPIASAIAAPISGYLLAMEGVLGFHGWQWMFILEAAPAVALGFVCLFFLTDKPEQATWLAPEQRDWLVAEMAKEQGIPERHSLREIGATLISWPVLRLSLVYFGLTTGLYGIELWLPQIVKGFGLSNIEVGFVSAIPYLLAIATMGLWARHSDRTGERFGHVAIACLVGCGGLMIAGLVHTLAIPTVIFLSLAIAGVMAARPPFWQLPPEFLSGAKLAGGIAAINSIGNLGGFVGPSLIGWAREATGSFTAGLMISAMTLGVSALFVLSLKRSARIEAKTDASVPVGAASPASH
ncbi:MFS transporter [Methylobacterium brachythecii]|uniref:Putative tartrate transporter n=1 Tax=Methylobacterium brachythecii TaxID=1176177 RepID=A0A7W6F5L3_9HYPH|nr:MFS transporter [Methylobacterium brachythecii]MBB3901384.1 ACS family tartrate transporter-like MFS transporter [Methylobacterium brachythecii]GLS42959.1 MFS transporter [Methylobacterium brachythecii]